MSIKVMITRNFKKMPVPENFQVINKIRKAAMQRKGYITGETLVGIEDYCVIVLSTWASQADWDNWLDSKERTWLEQGLTPFLTRPATTKVYMTSAEYKLQLYA